MSRKKRKRFRFIIRSESVISENNVAHKTIKPRATQRETQRAAEIPSMTFSQKHSLFEIPNFSVKTERYVSVLLVIK